MFSPLNFNRFLSSAALNRFTHSSRLLQQFNTSNYVKNLYFSKIRQLFDHKEWRNNHQGTLYAVTSKPVLEIQKCKHISIIYIHTHTHKHKHTQRQSKCSNDDNLSMKFLTNYLQEISVIKLSKRGKRKYSGGLRSISCWCKVNKLWYCSRFSFQCMLQSGRWVLSKRIILHINVPTNYLCQVINNVCTDAKHSAKKNIAKFRCTQ